jgi:hypothetical protein
MFPSGVRVDLMCPERACIVLSDIAHHLSQINRFTGGTKIPYSVARHSLLVMRMAEQATIGMTEKFRADTMYAGLMHDASEAYLGDVSKPLKGLLPEYQRLEEKWSAVLYSRFGVSQDPIVWDIVSDCDEVAWAMESAWFQRDGDMPGLESVGAKCLFEHLKCLGKDSITKFFSPYGHPPSDAEGFSHNLNQLSQHISKLRRNHQ